MKSILLQAMFVAMLSSSVAVGETTFQVGKDLFCTNNTVNPDVALWVTLRDNGEGVKLLRSGWEGMGAGVVVYGDVVCSLEDDSITYACRGKGLGLVLNLDDVFTIDYFPGTIHEAPNKASVRGLLKIKRLLHTKTHKLSCFNL